MDEQEKYKIEKIEKYKEYIQMFKHDTIFLSITYGLEMIVVLILGYDSIPFLQGDMKKGGSALITLLTAMFSGYNISMIADAVDRRNYFQNKLRELMEEEKKMK